MRFVTYTIQYGKGRDQRFDLRRIVEAVRGAKGPPTRRDRVKPFVTRETA